MSSDFDPYHKWLGISREQQPPNLYRLLGAVEFEHDPDVLSAAAESRIRHLRTFELGPQGHLATRLLQELKQAQTVLLVPADKARYDAWLHQHLFGLPPAASAALPMAPPTMAPPTMAPPTASFPPPLPAAYPPPTPGYADPGQHGAAYPGATYPGAASAGGAFPGGVSPGGAYSGATMPAYPDPYASAAPTPQTSDYGFDPAANNLGVQDSDFTSPAEQSWPAHLGGPAEPESREAGPSEHFFDQLDSQPTAASGTDDFDPLAHATPNPAEYDANQYQYSPGHYSPGQYDPGSYSPADFDPASTAPRASAPAQPLQPTAAGAARPAVRPAGAAGVSAVPTGHAGAGAARTNPSGNRSTSKATAQRSASGKNIYLAVVCTVAVCSVLAYLVIRSVLGNSREDEEKRIAQLNLEVERANAARAEKESKEPLRGQAKPGQRPVDTRALPPARPIDPASGPLLNLLQMVDIRRPDEGRWTQSGNELFSPLNTRGRLVLTSLVPQEYNLTIVANRMSGAGALGVGLMAEAKQFLVTLDGGDQNRSSSISNARPSAVFNDRASHREPVFQASAESTIVCQVRKNRISILANGQEVLTWSDKQQNLIVPVGWTVTKPNALFLVTTAGFRFSKIELQGVTPAAANQGNTLDREPITPTGGGNPDSMPSTPPEDDNSLASDRTPPPSAELLKPAYAAITEIFKDEIAKAKKPEERFAVAKSIYTKGLETRNDPVARFAALSMARDIAARVGEWVAALETIDEINKTFQVAPLEMKAVTLEAAADPVTPRIALNAFDQLLQLVDEAVEVDDYALASRLITLSHRAAKKTKDADTTKRALSRSKTVKALESQFATVKNDLEMLTRQPNNAAAKLSAGRWYAVAKGDWEKGLPLLAEGSDATLGALAKLELSNPSDPDAQVKVGDGWWDLSETESEPTFKSRLQQHAVDWYRQAQEQLTGLGRAKVDKRIAEAEKNSTGDSPNYIKLVNLPAVSAKAHRNAMGVNRIINAPEARTPPGAGADRACSEFLFAHAPSRLVYDVPAEMKEFRATGFCLSRTVTFSVRVDGREMMKSSPAGKTTIQVKLPEGAKRIELVADDLNDSDRDYSFWCYPRFYR